MKKKYTLVVNNYQKGKYLPLFEDCIVTVEKIDRSHHKVTFKVNDFEKTKIEKCFNRELQPR